jgi:hypothetical protein
MKKIILNVIIILLFQGAKGQDADRAMMKGHCSVNLYYGYRVSNSIYKSLVDENATDQTFKSFGPVGLVFEYMLSNVVGLGAEAGYGTTTLTFTDENYFSTGPAYYNYKYQITNLRLMVRANFHFLKSPHFDMYGLVSAGYRSNTYTFTSDEPGYQGETIGTFIPFGIKPGIGFRYFFDAPVGLHLELAAGTPALCGGLSFKF